MKLKIISALTLTSLLLAGCSLAPSFRLPDSQAPEAFAEVSDVKETGSWKVGEPSSALPRGEWWHIFKDEALNKLQDEAATGNLSLQVMAARVTQARATAGIATSYFFPTLDNTSSFTRQKPNAVARGMAGGQDLAIEDSYKTSFGLVYELDLFGSVLNNRRAAKADAVSAEGDYNSLCLALQADVAQLYFTLRALAREEALLAEAVKIREESNAILQKRLDAGYISELETAETIVDLETTRARLQDVMRQKKQALHAMALLLGRVPSGYDVAPGDLAQSVPVVPPGLPSALLERRPDIAAAQADLAAANARIGIARAAFFPSISLTGAGGFESAALGDVFEWSSRSWSLGPLVSIPIFSGGRASANLDRSWARYEEQVASYRQKVLEAFRDVEDSLIAQKTLAAQAQAQQTALAAAKRADELAQKRYDNGDLGYLEAITARRNALEVERQAIATHSQRLSNAVQLIRALGGGWTI